VHSHSLASVSWCGDTNPGGIVGDATAVLSCIAVEMFYTLDAVLHICRRHRLPLQDMYHSPIDVKARYKGKAFSHHQGNQKDKKYPPPLSLTRRSASDAIWRVSARKLNCD